MMKTRIWLLITILWISNSCVSGKGILRNEYTVVSYNVENLFDTVDDSKIPDDEFLPESKKKWDNNRYQKKLNDLVG